MGRLDDLLLLEKAGQLPPELQADLDIVRQAGEVPEPEGPSWLQEGAATAVEVGGAVLGGLGGAALGAPTGPGAVLSGAAGAAAGGALARPVADYIRGKETTASGVLSSAVTSAIPGGAAAKVGGGLVRRTLAHTLEGAVIGEVSTEARTRIEEGRAPTTEERLIGAGGGAVTGGLIGGVASKLSKKAPQITDDLADLTATASKIGKAQGAETPAEAVQLGLFDAEGHVRPELTVEAASTPATAELTAAVKAEGKEAADLLARTDAAEEGKRLYHQVAEAFEKGEIDAPGLVDELATRGISMPEYIRDYYKPTIRRAGRQLQQLSDLRKHLDSLSDPQAKEALEELSKVKASNRFIDILQKVDDTRRALLVSQVKTGVRNAFSQGLTYGTDLVEQAASQLVGGEGDFFGSLASASRALNRKESRAGVERLLAGRRDLLEKIGEFEYRPPNTYLDSPVLKPTLGKFVEATTWFNRAQEEFFRRATFDASVRQGLKKAGQNVEEALANPKLIPDDVLDNAVERALDLTFSNPNPGGLEKIVGGLQSARPITTFIAPFPRYMANAMTYVAKRNPLGLLRLATKGGREKAGEVTREAFMGTALLSGAIALRYKDGGEKWYELKVGDERVDTRGVLGPFGAYMFMGDAVKQYLDTGTLNYSPDEYLEGVLSMSRVAGTLQQLATFLKSEGEDPRTIQQKFLGVIGEWVSGFATPAKNVRDAFILAGDTEEGKMRDSRDENPFLGPTLRNIPGVSQSLPERPKLTTGEPIVTERPGASAFLGLNIRSTDAVEREINRLSIPLNVLAPKTGIPKADRELTRRVGKIVGAMGPKVIATQGYQKLSDGEKVMALKGLFKKARAIARDNLAQTNPKLAAALKEKRKYTRDEQRVLRERGTDVRDKVQEMVESAPEKAPIESAPKASKPAPAAPAPPASTASSIVEDGKVTQNAVEGVAQLVGLPARFLNAVMRHESRGGEADAVSEANARGPMQLIPPTFKAYADKVAAITGRPADIDDPLSNLVAGALHYRDLLEQTGGDVEQAALLYHAGPNPRLQGPRSHKYARNVARTYAGG